MSIIYGQLRMPKYRESLRNMQPFIDGERYLLDDHANELLSSYRWNNDLWSLPAYIDFLTVFYNKTIFDNAGIDYPQPHWTLTDFHDAATALTNQGEYGIIYGYMPFAGLDLDLNYFVEQKGGFLPYDSLEEMTFHSAIDHEKIADAVNWYSELFPIGETTSEIDISILLTEESNQSDRMQLIADNRVAMWTDYTSHTYGGMLEDLQIGVAPLPLDQGSLRWARPVGYMISAQSALPQQCWEWIKFLSSQPDAVQVAPVRYSQLDTRDEFDIHIGEFSVDEELKQEVISAYRFNIEHTDHILWRGNATLLSAFKAIITGTPIDLAVAEAIEKDTTYRTCLSKLQGDITPENSVACWQEIEAQ